jgi:hypothetical protein
MVPTLSPREPLKKSQKKLEKFGSKELILNQSGPTGLLKGKCAFGPFLSIIGDWVSTQELKCESMPMDEQSANHK